MGSAPQAPLSFPSNATLITAVDPLEDWRVGLLKNLLCYCSVWLFIYLWLRSRGHLKKAGKLMFAISRTPSLDSPARSGDKEPGQREMTLDWYGRLFGCAAGLLVSYLLWGVQQEKIMTQKYATLGANSEKHRFKDSQFLVFMNRIFAFFVAGAVMFLKQQPEHRAPLFEYTYCSFSNIMSSWCQYEALKFVTFPTQVVGKSAKTTIVMLTGMCISGRTYPRHQYLTAFLISVGVGLFLFSGTDQVGGGKKLGDSTTISGILLMAAYLLFDSFTTNWQSRLFEEYSMSPEQMMFAANFFSSCFTLSSLLVQGSFFPSLHFIFTHSGIIFDICVLSSCGAVGQHFIFYTIKCFGPATFTIITTIRQAGSVLISCYTHGHRVNSFGVFGIVMTFAALFLRSYLNRIYGDKPGRPKPEPARPTTFSVASGRAGDTEKLLVEPEV